MADLSGLTTVTLYGRHELDSAVVVPMVVPIHKRRHPLAGILLAGKCSPQRLHEAEYPHQVWAKDFQFNATADRRRLRFQHVIVKQSCLCLAIRVGRRNKANDVVSVLEDIASPYPAPTYIRSDNGPEFIGHPLRHWSKNSGTSTAYIEAGSPGQNGFTESFNSRFRDEFLNTEVFAKVAEA